MYAIKHLTDGYLTHDEDRIGGFSYQQEIDEYIVFFHSESDAALNCGKDEVIVKL